MILKLLPVWGTPKRSSAGVPVTSRTDDVTALKVVEDHLVLDRQEGLMGTLAALHPRLLADTADPLVRAGGRISLAARPGVAPEPRIDIVAATEKGAEEGHFLGGGHGRGRRWSQRVWARRRQSLRRTSCPQRLEDGSGLLDLSLEAFDFRFLASDRVANCRLGRRYGRLERTASVVHGGILTEGHGHRTRGWRWEGRAGRFGRLNVLTCPHNGVYTL